MLETKIKEVFSEMVVLKDPQRTEFFKNLSLPSFLRDWLVMKFSDRQGSVNYDSVLAYIKQYIPGRDDFEQIKYQLINGENVRFLARSRVTVDVKNGRTVFELPDFGGIKNGAGGLVDKKVADKWKDVLLRESENWGILELMWGRDYSSKQGNGVITLMSYEQFCPYTIDIEFYKEARTHFNIHEWIDVLMSAIDYNPNGFSEDPVICEQKKTLFLQRLLPFVERRINIIELAPKGIGKTYVYEKLSKRGWLVSSGVISRASLVYDNVQKAGGLITRFDYVGFDESQSIVFVPPGQIETALKGYMEFGTVQGFDAQIVADAGIVVLGNIDASRFNINCNMVEELNPIFQQAAVLDRFHGFIPGWEIMQRMDHSFIANGWALNTEYFTEVLHDLRDDLSYATIVDDCLELPRKVDQRDLTAIKRLCCAFTKLLYPHAKSKRDIPQEEFIQYCLNPAKQMRAIIKKQLCIVDPREFNVEGRREIPDIRYRV